MVLTLDIRKKAVPIIRQTAGKTAIKLQACSQNLRDDLGDLILSVEGFDNHVYALSKTEIKDLLEETTKVIADFVDIDEKKVGSEQSESDEIGERFSYALKALYKLRSLLHLAYTKDINVGKTPADIKEGLSAISRSAMLHNLSRTIR